MNPIDASRTLPPGAEGDLDLYLEKFEAERGPGVDLRDFLPPAAHPDYLAVLRELIRVDLEFAWEEGAERRLEFYREHFPELFADSESIRAVAWEEFRLRQAAGEAPTAAEYRDRFGVELSDLIGPAGSGPLPRTELFAADHHRADTDFRLATPSGMPEPGDAVSGFVVLSELGRGAFGRVFLARQSDLADRLVALKVSSRLPGEPRTLARLQHANIVPVYSVHRHGPYHVVCMPYHGSATLADLLDAFRGAGRRPRSGKDVVSTLADRAGPTLADSGPRRDVPATSPVEPAGPSSRALDALARLGYVDAVLWVGAQIADGLAHAHERGIVHRDVKPANVLLTDEGRPMLLDFNLAADAADAADPGVAEGGVGGTLRYMAPEALTALAERRANADPRSDVYALGLLLYELLTGEFPFPDQTGRLSEVVPNLRTARLRPPPDAARLRPDVTPAVAAILTKCLAPDPVDRYPSAAELREDLQRQLENKPLRYAPDRSVRERVRKWTRRHPRLASGTTVSAVAVVLLLIVSAGGWWWYREATRLEGQRLAAAIGRELELVRPLAGHGRVSAAIPTGQYREARDRCRAVLGPLGVTVADDWKDGKYVRRLTDDDRDRLCADVGQVLHLWAGAAMGLHERSADPAERAALLAEALAASDRAKAAFGDHCPDVVIDHRNRLRELAGLDRDETPGCPWDQVPGVAPGTAAYLSAVLSSETGNAAVEKLSRLVRDGWPSASAWTALGAAQLRLARWDDAARSLTAAAALAPDSPWAYFHRGVALLEAGRFADAERDFTQVLELNPDVPEARLNRAIARVRQQDCAGAVRDLDELERAGGGDEFPRLYFVREVAKRSLEDPAGADADRDTGLRREPRDPAGWVVRGEARLRLALPDAKAALADFEAAIQLDPTYPKAWENKAHVLSEHMDKPADAVRALDRAIQLHPDYVLARAGRAVLLARLGDRAAARADADECLKRDGSALTCYQAACAYLLTAEAPADRRKALDLLRIAIAKDATWARHMPDDPDLKTVRDSQEFKDLMTAAGVLSRPR